MTMQLTLIGLLIWFLWGLFMGMGWTLGSWIMGKILARLG